MQKFSEFVKEFKADLQEKRRIENANKFNELYEAKLKEYSVKSPVELSEDDSKRFYEYLSSLKEAEMTKGDVKKMVKDETKDLEKKVDAAEEKAEKAEDQAEKAKSSSGDKITDEKSFREYAMEVLKKAHPKDFDEKIANKVIDGIASKVKDDDWGAAVGRLTSGLGS
jgi:predicted Zn-dependent peptidase